MQQKNIQIHGINTHIVEEGTSHSRVIVLLHGVVGDALFHWKRLLPDLALDYHLIAPDLPGFGQTETLPQMTLSNLLAWLKALYQTYDLEQAVIVGNSFGGLIGRLYAAAYPQDVPALVLINGGNLPGRATPFARLIARMPIVSDLFFGMTSSQSVGSREALKWLVKHIDNPAIMTDEMIATAKNNSKGLANLMRTQILSEIPEARVPLIPTLILWGEEDDFAPLTTGERVHKAIPGSKWVPISECKNMPHVEEPEVIDYQIQQFLDNLGKPTTPDLPGAGLLG